MWRFKMKVSVIIPVYNTEKYLKRCIESLYMQTYKDMEVLFIDDGSTDGSSKILDEYEQMYPELFRVIHKQNSGISDTRNLGISLARGEYITFIDSDDYVLPNMIHRLYETAQSENADIVVCDYYEQRGNHNQLIQVSNFTPTTLQQSGHLLFDINSSPWNKIYRRELLMKFQIQYPDNVKYEDVYFVFQCLKFAQKIVKVNEPLLYYVIHDQSETTILDQRVFDIFKILDLVQDLFREEVSAYEGIHTSLEYFCINRLTTYNLQQVYQKDKKLVSMFITKSFQYLDNEFPNWKNNQRFHEDNSFAKRIIKKNLTLTLFYVKIRRILR